MTFKVEVVNWQEHLEELRLIRHSVFIEEQQVDPEEEWDEFDQMLTTKHFLGYLDGKAIAAGRLTARGKVGRICILKEFRRQGYGEEILKSICECAAAAGHENLYLHAQTSALPLYEKCGFKAEGEVFLEANIEHKLMRLQLDSREFLEQTYKDRVIRLYRAASYPKHLERMMKVSQRNIEILSHSLDSQVYNQSVANALSHFARNSRNSKIRILVRDSRSLVGRSHPLVALFQRLPSSIELRCLHNNTERFDEGFTIVDRRHLVFFNNEDEYQGFANYSARAESEHHLERFEYLWQYQSATDPNLSQLHL